MFDNITDPLIGGGAAAAATRAILLGAIFRTASNGSQIQSTFDHPNGFLDLTSTLYVSNNPLVTVAHFIVGSDRIARGDILPLAHNLFIS